MQGTKKETVHNSDIIQQNFDEISSQENNDSKLFEEYLKKTSQFSYLEYLWAYQGMKALIPKVESKKKIQLLICIYHQYISSGKLSPVFNSLSLIKINEEFYKENITESNSESKLNIFDKVTMEIQNFVWNVIYPQFVNQEAPNIQNLQSNNLQVHTKNALPIINEDGLPKVLCKTSSSLYYTSKKPTANDPEIFAKDLCQRLQALKLNSNRQIQKNVPCEECQKENDEAFSAKLAQAIERKLQILRNQEDSISSSLFDQPHCYSESSDEYKLTCIQSTMEYRRNYTSFKNKNTNMGCFPCQSKGQTSESEWSLISSETDFTELH